MPGPILVVDDDRSSREAMTLALKYYGFDVVPAASGEEGLAYLRGGGPAEMILLELMMPDMNGWTFRRAMQLDPWLAEWGDEGKIHLNTGVDVIKADTFGLYQEYLESIGIPSQ